MQNYLQSNQNIIFMSSIWNILSPVRTGVIKLAGSGSQLFGTVVQHAVNKKTVTVRVTAKNWNNKYKIWMYSHKNKQVHDQSNYCVTGDKVIIKNCQKASNTKAYYVKSIVKPFGRDDHYIEMSRILEQERKEMTIKQAQEIEKMKKNKQQQSKAQIIEGQRKYDFV